MRDIYRKRKKVKKEIDKNVRWCNRKIRKRKKNEILGYLDGTKCIIPSDKVLFFHRSSSNALYSCVKLML